MPALRRIIAAFLALLLFTGQSGYSLTLCYCFRDGHYHFEWPGQAGSCCPHRAAENEISSACASQNAKVSCCALNELLPQAPCCTHTTLIIKKTDPATTPSSKKQLFSWQEWAKRLSASGLTHAVNLHNIAIPSFNTHTLIPSTLSLCSKAQAHLCVWRN